MIGSSQQVRDPGRIQQVLGVIATRIRELREANRLSLQQLAARSGLATSTIQKVETGQMVPSVAVLMKIAGGLGRRPSELISDTESELQATFLRASDRYVLGSLERLQVERLSGDVFEPRIETWRLRVQPGFGSGEGKYGFEGEILLLCETGQLTVALGEREYSLGPGDRLHFKASIPHAWRNDSEEEAGFLIICDLPRRFRAVLERSLHGVQIGVDED